MQTVFLRINKGKFTMLTIKWKTKNKDNFCKIFYENPVKINENFVKITGSSWKIVNYKLACTDFQCPNPDKWKLFDTQPMRVTPH